MIASNLAFKRDAPDVPNVLEELADRFGAGIDANDTGEPLGPSHRRAAGRMPQGMVACH